MPNLDIITSLPRLLSSVILSDWLSYDGFKRLNEAYRITRANRYLYLSVLLTPFRASKNSKTPYLMRLERDALRCEQESAALKDQLTWIKAICARLDSDAEAILHGI